MNELSRFERFDEFFPELFRRFMRPATLDAEPMRDIRIDVDETEKAYTVRADIPGAKKEDIRIEVDGNRVSISAEVKKDYEEKKEGRTLVRETYRGSASRSFTLASDVDEASAAAKFENGVLELTLPKKAGDSRKQIAIK